MPTLLLDLTIVLGLAAVLSLLMKYFKQPLIIGYILVGIIVGPSVLSLSHSSENVEYFGQIGVALLLFLVGLRLQTHLIKQIGKIAVLIGFGQIVFTTFAGFAIATFLGFDAVPALYIALAFTFSSTIVVTQLLHNKGEQDSLYGRLATGIMLVQDIVALLIFLFLGSISPGLTVGLFVLSIAAKICLLLAVAYLLIVYVIPHIDKYFAESRQVLFVFALAICFIFATVFLSLGFSFELGALVAGVVLASSPYQREIAARVSTLQDFFLIMFFVVLGTRITPEVFGEHAVWVIAFSFYVLFINPFIVILLLRPFHYTLRTSFYAALTVAQISEFSLILLALGAKLGHIPATLVAPATLIGLITIVGSSIMVMNNSAIYNRLEPILHWMFGRDRVQEVSTPDDKVDALLFGCHRLGSGVLGSLKKMKMDYMIVDHDPALINELQKKHNRVAFGTADDLVFLETLPLSSAKIVISTIPHLQTNLNLVSFVRKYNQKAIVLCVAADNHEAKQLYEMGVTNVIIPNYLGRRYLIEIVNQNKLSKAAYQKERSRHHLDMQFTIT